MASENETRCYECDAEVDPATAVKDTDPWGRGEIKNFCNDDCQSNSSEAYWLKAYTD